MRPSRHCNPHEGGAPPGNKGHTGAKLAPDFRARGSGQRDPSCKEARGSMLPGVPDPSPLEALQSWDDGIDAMRHTPLTTAAQLHKCGQSPAAGRAQWQPGGLGLSASLHPLQRWQERLFSL